jgi:hypothetical protein
MPKYFLLIAGDYYYPMSKTKDWIGCFETKELALAEITTKNEYSYYIQGSSYEWYEIVDLREWINK